MIKSWNSKSNDQVLESDSPTSGAFPVNSWHGGLIFVLHASDENQICFLLLPICLSCVFSLHWLIYPNVMAIQKFDKIRSKRDSDTRKVWRFCLIRCWFRPKQRTDCNWFTFFLSQSYDFTLSSFQNKTYLLNWPNLAMTRGPVWNAILSVSIQKYCMRYAMLRL